MNSNKATVIILCILGLLLVVTVFNLNRSKSIQYEYDFESYFAWIDGEGDITMVYVPDRGDVFHTRRYFGEVKRILDN